MITRGRTAAAGLLVALVSWMSPGGAGAQTVVQVQGSGSTLIDGYGATANFWRPGADGWFGIGYLDGLRMGAFLRTGLGRDTLRLGNDVLPIRFPTDVFDGGQHVLVQGAGVAGGDRRTSYALFGGASASGFGAYTFQPSNVEEPLGALVVARRLSRSVRLSGTTVVAERQTAVPGIEWQPIPELTAAVSAGVGSNQPYAASSVVWRLGRVGVRASYAWNSEGFRRVAVPTPYQTEHDRENIQLTYDLGRAFTVGVARQNFVQDSAGSRPPVRASGNSAFAGGRLGDWRLTTGVYDSRSQGIGNLSSYYALGRALTPWFDAEMFVLQSRPDGRPTSTTPLANLRWRLSNRLGLMQQVSYSGHRATVLFGANVLMGLGEFGVDYTIVHQPFQPFNPFRSALNITARLQLGSYATNFGTYVRSDGAVDYSASGSTFLYMGPTTGAQPLQMGSGRMAHYLVRGTVRDETGAPVEGAALDIGGQVVFTNASGAFFLRDGRPRRLPVTVLLDEFLLPGRWEVVSAPASAEAQAEGRGAPLEIVLRRVAPVSAGTEMGSPRSGQEEVLPGAAAAPSPPADAGPVAAPRPAVLHTLPSAAQPGDTGAVAAETLDLDRDILGPYRIPAHFPWGSRRVPLVYQPALDSLAARLVRAPQLVVEIRGHADATGEARANLALSRARAREVRRYLMERGVPADRIRTRGLGEAEPIGDNRTREGRAQNRRVELHRSGD